MERRVKFVLLYRKSGLDRRALDCIETEHRLLLKSGVFLLIVQSALNLSRTDWFQFISGCLFVHNLNSTEGKIVIMGLLTEKEQRGMKRWRSWVRTICKKRIVCGKFHLLHPDILSESTFFEHFRTTYRKVFWLMCLFGPNISSGSTIRVPMSHQYMAARYTTLL